MVTETCKHEHSGAQSSTIEVCIDCGAWREHSKEQSTGKWTISEWRSPDSRPEKVKTY